jgi:hypothetical protein
VAPPPLRVRRKAPLRGGVGGPARGGGCETRVERADEPYMRGGKAGAWLAKLVKKSCNEMARCADLAALPTGASLAAH